MTNATQTGFQSDIRDILCDMQDAMNSINQSKLIAPLSDWHKETQQGIILQSWEKLAALTGNHDLALQKGFDMPQHLLDLPRNTKDTPENQDLRSAMLQVLEAADAINNPSTQDSEHDTAIQQHDQANRQRLALAWQRIAVSTGNCRLALQQEPRQPIVPFKNMRTDPLRDLGVAAVHLEPALALYRSVMADPDSPENPDRLREAEEQARLAYLILWTISQSLQGHQQDPRDQQVTRCCQQTINRLNHHRQRATHAMGLPLPQPRDLSVFTLDQPNPKSPA